MDKDLEQDISNLLKLAKNNQVNDIYEILNNFQGSTKEKGDLFEYFLAGLYEGIGCKVEVKGGKNDGGVDLVIYYGNAPSKVYAIVQAKNVKTRLTKEKLQSEYAKFFGNDSIPDEQASVEKYNCKDVIIISLNGYIKNTEIFKAPNGYEVHLYDWSDVKKLIRDYSNTSHKKCPFLKKSNKIYIVVIILLLIAAVWYFYKDDVDEYHALNNEMLARLNSTRLSSYVKKDCQKFNYPVNTCRQKLVYKYMKKYNNSLEKGLMVYFCGETNFKRGNCGKKLMQFVLYGE